MKRIPAIAVLLLAGCVSANAGRAHEMQQYPQWVVDLAERRVEQQQEEPEAIISSPAPRTEAVPVVVAKQPKPTRVREEARQSRRRDIARTTTAPTPPEPQTPEEKTAEATRLMFESAQMLQELQALQEERREQLEYRQRQNVVREKRLRSQLP